MKAVLNKDNDQMEFQGIPCTIVKLSSKIFYLDNAKKTPYQMGDIKYVRPGDGKTAVSSCKFYKAYLDTDPEGLVVGAEIEANFQADGEYAGRAYAVFGAFKVADMEGFGAPVTAKKTADADLELDN